jgi:DNA-binding CsgD family transcriptional regulator
MPDAPRASPALASPPAARRDRSIRARREAREAKAEREQQIISLLNRGVSVAEIARRSGVSIMHMRKLVRTILADRAPEPPAEFLALQVSRLNEALLVSYSAMYSSATGTNFEAVDRVVKIVRELDRYHGFAAVPRPREAAGTRLLPPPAESPIATPQDLARTAETIQIGAATD